DQPLEIQRGFHMLKQVNDEYGRGTEWTYYDSKLHPVDKNKHCFVIRQEYDESGKLTEQDCFDYAGEGVPPTFAAFKIPIERFQYDRFGNESDYRMFVSPTEPMNSNKGRHEIRSTSDEFGHVVSERYYDRDGHPVEVDGFHAIERKYNDSSLVEVRYLDARNLPL